MPPCTDCPTGPIICCPPPPIVLPQLLECLCQACALTHLARCFSRCCQLLCRNGFIALDTKGCTQCTGLLDRLLNPFLSHYLNPAVFFAMLLGCATNCLPAALPARLALVVAAYSAGDKDLIAASGKYRSPVFDEGFPDLVRHFWAVQFLREACGAFNLCSPHLLLCTSWQAIVLCVLTTDQPPYPALLNS